MVVSRINWIFCVVRLYKRIIYTKKKTEYIKFILNSEWNVKEGIGDKYTKKKLY